MSINRMKKFIRKKLYEYPLYDRLIIELEQNKETATSKDINSFIQSKNKISNSVESKVIKNIACDQKINEYKKWQKLIDNILQEFRKNDKIKLKIVEYKFFGNIPEDIIAEELYISKSTVRSYLKDIYFEVGIMATLEGLINKNNIK